MFTRLFDSDLFDYVYPVLLIGFMALGYYLAHKLYQLKKLTWQASGVESSVIGLFALLLGFTFSSASGTIRDRNQAIHEQSNALANYHRSTLMGEDSLRQFTGTFLLDVIKRMEQFNEVSDRDLDKLTHEVDQIQRGYLATLRKYNQSHPGAGDKYISGFNAIKGSFYRVMGTYHQRIPEVVIVLLVLSSLLISMLIGFMNGHGKQRHFLAPLIYVVLVVLSVQAIRDLDNPSSGSVRPGFNSFAGLREYIESTGQ